MPLPALTKVPKGSVIKLSITLPGRRFDGLSLTLYADMTPAEAAGALERKLVRRFVDQFLPHEDNDA